MIHCKALLTFSVSTTRIASSGKNQLVQYLEQVYLVTIASRQDWKIHLHRVNHVSTDRIKLDLHDSKLFNLLLSKVAIRTRTENLLIRNQLLYPIGLWQLIFYLFTAHCNKAAVFTWNRLNKKLWGEKLSWEQPNSRTLDLGLEPSPANIKTIRSKKNPCVATTAWSWWSEIRTLQTHRNRFTVGLLFQLHIHQ